MSSDPNLSRLSIYKWTPSSERCRQESVDIFHLLWRLDKSVPFDDVIFGTDPPDFIFKIQGQDIGAELTDIDPTIFAPGVGHHERGRFKKWETKVEDEKRGVQETFSWSQYTLGETLAALEHRLKAKQEDVPEWKTQCREKWLLMRVADGSPLGELLGGEREILIPGTEEDATNYFAKAIYEVNAICTRAKPFDRVLIFQSIGIEKGGGNLLTFSTGAENRYNLPEPSEETLRQGAVVSGEFLNRKRHSERSMKVTNIPLGQLHEHFRPKSQTKL